MCPGFLLRRAFLEAFESSLTMIVAIKEAVLRVFILCVDPPKSGWLVGWFHIPKNH